MKSVFPTDNKCLLCGRQASETHHIRLGNHTRKYMERYGLTCRLCHECHERVTLDKEVLQKKAQAKLLETMTYEDYMETFGKDYINGY